MRVADLIRRKRDGMSLQPAEIFELIRLYTAGEVGDEQMAAFCMAVFFRGMKPPESEALVQAMLHSGEVLDWSHLSGPKIDKHSTGGVGDKVSICLAPLVSACGVIVPMISGRGLGHTGGTLDKLGAIPGFRTDLEPERFRRLVDKNGLAFAGQTEQLAPADRRLYALRDVTGTVESVPLIAASIMSKKLAEGIDGLVLDVKSGSGAFMKTLDAARQLALALIEIGDQAGKSTCALVTNMDQVLGSAVGNANETWEAVSVLRGEGPNDVRELTLRLGEEMLLLGKAAANVSEARERLEAALTSGKALEKLLAVVEDQDGDPRALEARSNLPDSAETHEVRAPAEGFVSSVDVEAVGRAAMVLGAGRARVWDAIDPGVGLEIQAQLGDFLPLGGSIARIHHRGGRGLEEAERLLEGAFSLAETVPNVGPLVYERLGGSH